MPTKKAAAPAKPPKVEEPTDPKAEKRAASRAAADEQWAVYAKEREQAAAELAAAQAALINR